MAIDHLPAIRSLLARAPCSARDIAENRGISQPTVSRALRDLGDDCVRFGPYQSIQYALRRPLLAEKEVPVYRVTPEGRLEKLGDLAPVLPAGYVMRKLEGEAIHSEGFPWWLQDLWPQGFLGRAYVAAMATPLGLPERLGDWQEHHVLRALLSQSGSETVGNLLLGEQARTAFLQRPDPRAIAAANLPDAYVRLAREAMGGGAPESSAGGEQPKFTTHVETPRGPRHVLVKFTLPGDTPVTQRWRDLLLAEHHALDILRESGPDAVTTRIIDQGGQRFLEVERFDRIGPHGRRGLVSLMAVDMEFVGLGRGPWPSITAPLARAGHITPEAHHDARRLHAFGTLIGNTDMHPGNLSFVTDSGRPCALAPAYDMLPMAFAPRASGELPETLGAAVIDGSTPPEIWREAGELAGRYLQRLREEKAFSRPFAVCIAALEAHLARARQGIERLG